MTDITVEQNIIVYFDEVDPDEIKIALEKLKSVGQISYEDRPYIELKVEVTVDIEDFETSDLEDELETRDFHKNRKTSLLSETESIELIKKIELAMYQKNDVKILEATKEYFYERYNIHS
jgi:hypothetical protein